MAPLCVKCLDIIDSDLRTVLEQINTCLSTARNRYRSNSGEWNNHKTAPETPQSKSWKDYLTYASSFPFSSDVILSFWLFSFDWHPMARYWATSGWTKLSICVLLGGSITSPCSSRCSSTVSTALCWLVNEYYTIKIHPARLWVGDRAARLVTHAVWALCFTSRYRLRQKSFFLQVWILQL